MAGFEDERARRGDDRPGPRVEHVPDDVDAGFIPA